MNDSSVLILGAAGQDGHYLAETHRRRNDSVLSYSRTPRGDIEQLNVADRPSVEELIRRLRPRVVYQLAAASTTSHEALWDNHAAIAVGSLNVLEAVWKHSRETAVVVIGSALQFQNRGAPIRETDPFEATSPYALARIEAAYAARYYRSRGLRAYVAYLFHHESPMRGPTHVSARICRTVAAIARGDGETLEVGDPEVQKEWGYAGDVAEALATLAQQEGVFEVVVGTGVAHTIREWVGCCFAQVGLSAAGRLRDIPGFKAEYRRIVSDPSSLKALGWNPQTDINTLAGLMMRKELGLPRGAT